MKYKHYIITRFNLKHVSKDWENDKSGNEVLTDKWMKKRMSLFFEYCVPGVYNQYSKNFKWLIYIDKNTKGVYKKQLQDLTNEFNYIIIKQVNSYQDFMDNYCNDILSITETNCSHIITTRLDNDDIIHKDMIRKVQETFNFQDFVAVNFLKILMLNPTDQNKLFIDYQFSNHFISLIEKISSEGIKGCYSRGDTFWDIHGEITQITEKPYCVEIISTQNLLNDFRGFSVLKSTSLLDFNLKGKYRSSYLRIANYQFWKMSWKKYFRYFRVYLLRIF